MSYFATVPKGLEELLMQELTALGAQNIKQTRAGCHFEGGLEVAYRVCLWSRLANRVLLPLQSFAAPTPDALYAGVHSIPWHEHMAENCYLAVDFSSSSSAITHSHYGALRVKDAIVDYFRERSGERPSIDTQTPDILVNVYLHNDHAQVSLDLSGASLHRRGYRRQGSEAPLKENLAAAILQRAKWAEVAKNGGAFVDPMCGSGTLAIEAAMIASDMAPGLMRENYGFLRWHGHDAGAWEALMREARERFAKGRASVPAIVGYDVDPRIIAIARSNAARCELTHLIRFETRDIGEARPPEGPSPGIVATNPPYGERLGEAHELPELYRRLGDTLKDHFAGYTAWVITSEESLARAIALRADRKYTVYNGALQCLLLKFPLLLQKENTPSRRHEVKVTAGAEMFANRLRKNVAKLKRFATREGLDAYRVYDSDLPEYAVAIDVYNDWACVQEYQAPADIDPRKAAERLNDVMAMTPDALGIPKEHVVLKVRKRQRGTSQYEKYAKDGDFFAVREYGHEFLVNLTDYLDTGLFLDHRLTRKMLGTMATGKRFLNLFCYTGTATVHAARGGAVRTVSVDMSNTYLDWAEDNFELNHLAQNTNTLVQADCLQWLEDNRDLFDLIFVDPPTFSNSKRMEDTWDVQRDHVYLLELALKRLARGGTLVFSTNSRKFKLATEAFADWNVQDITARTIPEDYARNPRIHQVYMMTRRSE